MNGVNTNRARRDFLRAGISLAGLSFVGVSPAKAQSTKPADEKDRDEEEIGPAEDLMREHGVLTRILLIYEESTRRLDSGNRTLAIDPLKQSAGLVRSFVEDYHERLEERYLFPRFKKAGMFVELVDTLQTQHDAGRRMTDAILRLAAQTAFDDDAERGMLVAALRGFIRMYLPHAAREDTVLFPAFRKLALGEEYGALGEAFEKKEHDLFGADGFQNIVEKVVAIEKQLGIYDLKQFTPP